MCTSYDCEACYNLTDQIFNKLGNEWSIFVIISDLMTYLYTKLGLPFWPVIATSFTKDNTKDLSKIC